MKSVRLERQIPNDLAHKWNLRNKRMKTFIDTKGKWAVAARRDGSAVAGEAAERG